MIDRNMDTELGIAMHEHVAIVEMRRPPHNYFDLSFVTRLAQAFETLDADDRVRATVLCAQGDAFSAGANLVDPSTVPRPVSEQTANPIYAQAIRLFALQKPMVAAVHGSAVGGGLGLALVADFRVTCAEARFSANFARLGITPGFGLTATLPRLIGAQRTWKDLELHQVTYFLGRNDIVLTNQGNLPMWRKRLFAFMSRNSAFAGTHFGLEASRVVESGALVEL